MAANPGKGTRRDNGAGSAYFDASRGTWRGEVTCGTRPDGRRDTRKVSGASRAEVLAKLKAIRRQYEAGQLGTPDQERRTLGEYLERWLAAKAGTVRGNTLAWYRRRLRLHVLPTLGRTPLKDLRPDAVQRLYAQLLTRGLHPRTIRHTHQTLSSALGDALKWGETTRNVCALVTPPTVAHRELQPPTGEEVGCLLAAAQAHGDHLAALYAVAALTGARLGELCGLRWADVDLERPGTQGGQGGGTMHVRRSLTDVKAGVPTFSEPKTARSRRAVPLSAPAVGLLKAHRTRQLEERLALAEAWGLGITANLEGGGLVFCTLLGTGLRRGNVSSQWKGALKRAGLRPGIRFHDLRHAAASLMLAGGQDIASVSAILGHASPAITLSVYSHAVPHRLQAGADALARAIPLPTSGAAERVG